MTKTEKYKSILPQISAVMDNNVDIIANMANMAAMLHENFGFWWTGFYRVMNNELVLGPFQGPLACTRIAYGRGVCGTASKERRTIVVPDVEEFLLRRLPQRDRRPHHAKWRGHRRLGYRQRKPRHVRPNRCRIPAADGQYVSLTLLPCLFWHTYPAASAASRTYGWRRYR